MRGRILAALLAAAMLNIQPANAADVAVKADVAVAKDADAVVVELFTSQGCSSCPPAQGFLYDLAQRADVVALELHVDYWDHLKTLLAGAWKDPFSSPVWTQRQIDYNMKISESENVYTPQVVVDGRLQAVGANRRGINALIDQARVLRAAAIRLTPPRLTDGLLLATVDGPGIKEPAHVILARLMKEKVTEITAGENRGDRQKSANIVTEMMTIGTWDGGREEYKATIPAFKEGEGCALLLQDPETLHILAGTMCGL